ncbi:hypothetical protein [Mycolicibacterium sp. F2034L]|uniref:hypothetical protein n=1 Tax=Mycolicibacterium sp. F2034L TaxID=2926422 RepID=UPI001FF333D6|nr:hypothetical protein [Mycolicibacterium sp. F2034L]MCK0177629.1 hypothetical protein [Mycolicibacterium sp. F2034L]
MDTERKSASDDPKVRLPDPCRPDDDQKQLAYRMFDACGLTVLSWGPLSLERLVEMLLAVAPEFRHSEISAGGAGSLPGHDGMWLGLDGPSGSLIAYFVTGGDDGQKVVDHVLDPIQQLPAPTQWGISTRGGHVATSAANVFAGARFVPLWELPPFADRRPAEQAAVDVPPGLAVALTGMGWDQIGDNAFRSEHPVVGGGLQTVFFGSYSADTFALMAPVQSSAGDTIPAAYRGRSFGDYQLDLIGGMVMLCRHFPAGQPPAPDTTAREATALAEYAHRQTQAASSLPPPTRPAYASATVSPPPPRPAAAVERPVAPQSQRSKNPTVIAAAIVAVGVVAAAAIFALTRSGGGGGPSTAAGGGSGSDSAAVSVDEVRACTSLPNLESESVGFGPGGLTISTRVEPTCSEGDLLTNSKLRVTAVDGAGNSVASGVFDLSSTPIATASGTSVDFTFPAGTYWRTADSIVGGLRLTAHEDGYDSTPSGSGQSASAVTAVGVGAPESGDIEGAAQSALVAIAAADRAVVDTTLLDVWQPQVSSKRTGLFADGITWSNPDILREHLEFRQRYPNARLLWSGDWPVYSDPTWWVTVSGIPFNTGEQALGWCVNQGYDWEHCFAKMVSRTKGSSGTTMLQKR